ncbi:YjfB family protein [Cohnella silvisoli]|uniref:YjfB family protein n=1 Tax=Cohnella silvisoli TaxID=2873699 RepID=A0ABV1KWY6_9BACL|nr:YjfB family protein [Cohnella silvisoli]MCD9023695.1 YjfB family protein [Cohnella silvisoli]
MSSVNGLLSAPAGSLQQQVGIAVLAKSLDFTEQQGAQMAQLLQQSVQPHLGGKLDIKV